MEETGTGDGDTDTDTGTWGVQEKGHALLPGLPATHTRQARAQGGGGWQEGGVDKYLSILLEPCDVVVSPACGLWEILGFEGVEKRGEGVEGASNTQEYE